jgi:hypothetical protein
MTFMAKQRNKSEERTRKISSSTKNCLFCRRFKNCNDPKKKYNYVCDRFAKYKVTGGLESPAIIERQYKSPADFKDFDASASSNVFIKQIDDAVSHFTKDLGPINLKVDDRDLPLAANFIEFCGPNFLNVELRAKQAEIASHTFAEYCPKCSNKDYMNDYPIADSMDSIKENVVFLEHGKCPNCANTRFDFFKKGLIKLPTQIAGLAGQRCVAGNTLILTDSGYMRIDRLFAQFSYSTNQTEKTNLYGYKGPKLIMHDKERIMPLSMHKKESQALKIIMENGLEIEGSPIHPLQVYDLEKDKTVFKTLDKIKKHDVVLLRGNLLHKKGLITPPLKTTGKVTPFDARFLQDTSEGLKKYIIHYFNTATNVGIAPYIVVARFHTYDEANYLYCALSQFGVFGTIKKIRDNDYPVIDKNNPYVLIIKGEDNFKEFLHSIGDFTRKESQSSPVIKTILDNLAARFQMSKIMSNPIPSLLWNRIVDEMQKVASRLIKIHTSRVEKYAHIPERRFKIESIQGLITFIYGAIPPTAPTSSAFYQNLKTKGNTITGLQGILQIIESSMIAPNTLKPVIKIIKKVLRLMPFSEVVNIKKIKETTLYDFQVPDYNCYIGNAIINHNSGKTALARMQLAYCYHRLLKLPNPQYSYGTLPTEILYSQLIALSFTQSKELMYDVIYQYLTQAPWFKQYNELLNHHQQKSGEELFKIKDTFAFYRHKLLFIAPYGPDKRKLRGRTGYAGGIDELSWLISSSKSSQEDNQIKINGEEIYTAVNNTFSTLVPAYYKSFSADNYNLPPPLLSCTSSPTSKKDMTTRLYEISKTSKYIYGYHMATWELNPFITREMLDTQFKLNYAKAMRDFGAVPPHSLRPFIGNKKQLKSLISTNRNPVKVITKVYIMPNGEERTGAEVRFLNQKSNSRHGMSIDAGYNNNSFAIVLGYTHEETRKPIIDAIVEIIPASQEQPISFNAVYENVICPLIEHFNVQLVISDRWQNIKLLSDIEEQYEITVETFSPKYKVFDTFRTDIEVLEEIFPSLEVSMNKIDSLAESDYPRGFENKPVAHLIYQMITVQDMLKDVVKGDGATDDIFRATINLYNYLTNPAYEDLVMGLVEDDIELKPALGTWGSQQKGFTRGSGHYTGIGGLVRRK